MKRAFLFVIGLLFSSQVFGQQSMPLSCATVLSTSIRVEGEVSQEDRHRLVTAASKMLDGLKNNFALPEKVYFEVGDYSPKYEFGTILTKYPYFENSLDGNPITKSAEASVAIALHEMVHQIFETHLMKTYKTTKPELLWAYFTRVDMRGIGLTEALIEETKKNSSYKNQSTQTILDLFVEFTSTGLYYNELFADLLPVLFFENPDAIYNSIYLPQLHKNGDAYQKEFQETHRFRRFGIPHTYEEIQKFEYQDPYMILSPTKHFIWNEIYKKNAELKDRKLPFGVVAEKLLKAMIASFEDVTNGFSNTGRIPIETLNSNLQMHIKKEFQR